MAPGRPKIRAAFAAILSLLGACADTETASERAAAEDSSIEEVREFIRLMKPRPVGHVRFRPPLRWQYVNDYFVIVEGRSGRRLVEMESLCNDLGSGSIYSDMADTRSARGLLRSNLDTIRGCRVREIYDLDTLEGATDADESGQRGVDKPEPES